MRERDPAPRYAKAGRAVTPGGFPGVEARAEWSIPGANGIGRAGCDATAKRPAESAGRSTCISSSGRGWCRHQTAVLTSIDAAATTARSSEPLRPRSGQRRASDLSAPRLRSRSPRCLQLETDSALRARRAQPRPHRCHATDVPAGPWQARIAAALKGRLDPCALAPNAQAAKRSAQSACAAAWTGARGGRTRPFRTAWLRLRKRGSLRGLARSHMLALGGTGRMDRDAMRVAPMARMARRGVVGRGSSTLDHASRRCNAACGERRIAGRQRAVAGPR